MTLAIILFFSFSCTASNGCFSAGQSTPQNTSDSPVKTQESAQQGQSPPTSSPAAASASSAPSQTPSDLKPSATKRSHRKKKIIAVKCSDIPAAATGSGISSATSAEGAGTNTTAQSAPTNCPPPPPKIIVLQGGTSEPSIQLEGGDGGDQAAHQRNSANQILETTQHNLNQLAGRQLDENQKNMLKQVHEFMQQAKNAVTGGDLDRARTLAWKAQLLSEELIKPGN